MDLIGIKNALLANISAIAGLNDPQYKITPVGVLKMVLENNAVKEVTNLAGLQSGQDTTIKVRAMQRGTIADVSEVDDCETTITPAFVEHEITKTLFAKVGIFLSEPLLRQFEAQAAQNTNAGGAPIPTVLYELILTHAQSLIQAIDTKIVTALNSAWGVNAVTGSSSPQTINLSTSPTDDDGMVKLILDAEKNEVNGDLLIAGSGIIRGFEALDKLKTGTDQGGFGALGLKIYNDVKTGSIWGANHFAVIQQGSIGFVDWQKNAGTYGGQKGNSFFFTIPVPMQLANGELSALVLDAQIKYQDCPVYSEGTLVAPRGWILELSKSFGVYTAPTTMYKAGDDLAGVNGIFHYIAAKQTPVYQTQEVAPMVNVTGITTDEATKSIVVAATYDFASHLTVAPTNATAKNQIIYSSATPAKATVSQLGVVTGVAAGTSVITATTLDGSYTASVTVTVTAA